MKHQMSIDHSCFLLLIGNDAANKMWSCVSKVSHQIIERFLRQTTNHQNITISYPSHYTVCRCHIPCALEPLFGTFLHLSSFRLATIQTELLVTRQLKRVHNFITLHCVHMSQARVQRVSTLPAFCRYQTGTVELAPHERHPNKITQNM